MLIQFLPYQIPVDLHDKDFLPILQEEPLPPLALVAFTEEEQVGAFTVHIGGHARMNMQNYNYAFLSVLTHFFANQISIIVGHRHVFLVLSVSLSFFIPLYLPPQRNFSMSVNSAAVLRLMGRGGGPVGPGAPRGRSTSRGRGEVECLVVSMCASQ